MKIKRKLFIAFHSQTDEQIEHQNNIMKQYFKTYVNFQQDNWVKLLLMTEFAYNNAKHAFTRMSPFEIMLEYSSKMAWEDLMNERVKSKSAKQHVKELNQLMTVLKERLHDSQKHQTKYKDVRTKAMKFQVEDYVHLNEKNIRTKRNRKLKWKQFESFKILEKIENQAYKLNLSKRWRIHNVFHVSLLEKNSKRKEKVFTAEPTYTPENIKIKQDDDDQEYFVNEIVDSKIFKEDQISNKPYSDSKLYYLID